LVADDLRFGVRERILYDGSIEQPLDSVHLRSVIEELQKKGIESIAVSFLYSFANTAHEDAVLAALEPFGVPVSLSSRILPEYREYERTSTTVINAYLAPVMSRYLLRLQKRLEAAGAVREARQHAALRDDCAKTPAERPYNLRVMQSNGGAVQSSTAASAPVRTILSGPAGGVVGAFHVGQVCGYSKLITFDMGGTSTDVSLCENEIKVTHESQIDG